jgi:hypothetical protein
LHACIVGGSEGFLDQSDRASNNHLEAKLDTYVKNHLTELENDLLLAQDWIQLRTIWKFLGVFKRSTLAMEGDYFRLDRVHVEMEIMMAWIAEVLAADFGTEQWQGRQKFIQPAYTRESGYMVQKFAGTKKYCHVQPFKTHRILNSTKQNLIGNANGSFQFNGS